MCHISSSIKSKLWPRSNMHLSMGISTIYAPVNVSPRGGVTLLYQGNLITSHCHRVQFWYIKNTKSILFGFPRTSDGVFVINYCMPYTKYYIYQEKLNDNNKKPGFNVDFQGYLCYLKGILKIEQNICFEWNQTIKFDKFKVIYNLIYSINVVLIEPAMYFCGTVPANTKLYE